MKTLNSGHLRVLKNLSVIKRCPLLGGSLTKIVTFETKHSVCYSRHVRYWEVSLQLLGTVSIFDRINDDDQHFDEHFFFLSGFSFTGIDNTQDSRGREGTIFYSTLPLPSSHKHSDTYLQLCKWLSHIFNRNACIYQNALNEVDHLIELLFDWLMM